MAALIVLTFEDVTVTEVVDFVSCRLWNCRG